MKRLSCGIILVALLFSMAQGVQANESNDYLIWKNKMLSELDTSSDEETGNTTFAFDPITKETRELLLKRIGEAKEYSSTYNNDPVLWWIMGMLGQMKRGEEQLDLKEKGKPNPFDAPRNQAMIKEYQSYYRKALDADDDPGAPSHLKGKNLVQMIQDVLAPPDIAKRAGRKALDISIAGGMAPYGDRVGSYQWYMYELLLGAYAEAGDNELYLKTINEMMERYPGRSGRAGLLEYKRDAEAEIERQRREKAGITDQQDVYAKAKATPKVQASEVAQKPD